MIQNAAKIVIDKETKPEVGQRWFCTVPDAFQDQEWTEEDDEVYIVKVLAVNSDDGTFQCETEENSDIIEDGVARWRLLAKVTEEAASLFP